MAARLLALCLAAALAPAGLGCFVWDELDKGEAIMEEHGGGVGRDDAAARRERGRGAPGPAPGEGQEEGFDPSEWWRKARTIAPGGGSDASEGEGESSSMVLCRMGRRERFMRRGECLGRGGTPTG